MGTPRINMRTRNWLAKYFSFESDIRIQSHFSAKIQPLWMQRFILYWSFFEFIQKKFLSSRFFFWICFVWDTEEAKKSSKSKINQNSITPFQHIIISKCNKIPEQKKEERNESEWALESNWIVQISDCFIWI